MLDVVDAAAGAVFTVEVRPGARRSGVAGVLGSGLKVEVTAAPEKGKANKALVRLLAEVLGVPRSDIEIRSGAASRTKRVLIKGMAADRARRILSKAAGNRNDNGGKG